VDTEHTEPKRTEEAAPGGKAVTPADGEQAPRGQLRGWLASWRDPVRVYWWWLAVQTVAALLALIWLSGLPPIEDWALLAWLSALTPLAGGLKVGVTVGTATINPSFLLLFFALVTLGAPAAAMVNVLACGWAMSLNRRSLGRRFSFAKIPFHRALHNVTNWLLGTVAAGAVLEVWGGGRAVTNPFAAVAPVFAATVAYTVVNVTGFVVSERARLAQRPFGSIWNETFRLVLPGYLAGASLVLVVWSGLQPNLGPLAGLAMLLPPAYLIYKHYALHRAKQQEEAEHLAEIARMNQAIVTSLATAIDAKDRYTHRHIHRVREYALALGERLQISREEMEALRIASVLHDIGKIGIPEKILCKPGKLTPEEFEIIKTHVAIGAAILEPIAFRSPVVPIVLGHHERWDGLGYPQGLKGEEIPIGARVLALVDVFDALTSDRPYRRAMQREEAIEYVRQAAGTQFDPRVVQTFIEILPEVEERIREQERTGEIYAGPSPQQLVARLEAIHRATTQEPQLQAVLGDLAVLAGDTPNLALLLEGVAACVARVVPHQACAIFLTVVGSDEVEAAYVSGQYASLLRGLRIRMGEGAVGHVMDTGQPLVNVSAALDLARRVRPDQNLELTACLCVPLKEGDRTFGAVALYSTTYNFFRPNHARQMMRVAEQAAPLVSLALQFERTRQLVTEDPLTRLPNAQSMLHFLRHQLAESRRREQPFAVVLAVVDGYPEYVRRHGAEEGQRVLSRVAGAIVGQVRDMDFVARYAENEFVVILPHCDETDVGDVVERLRREVMLVTPAPVHPLALRIGAAVYPRDATDVAGLLTATERNLLQTPLSV